MKARIFISSTYRDLRYLREQVANFVRDDYHFEPVAFEDGTIPYKPEQSMVKSCFDAVKSCHAMILIIGNRYGYKTEANISVTRNEYREAVRFGKPIFAFVENSVYGEYEIYKEYIKNGEQYKPVIADNLYVLEFIHEVMNSGRWVKDFQRGVEIISFLKSQWAGFFSEYLIGASPTILPPPTEIKKTYKGHIDYIKFKEELQRQANSGDASAMLVLGYYHLLGNIYFEKNFEKAFHYIQSAAIEQDYPSAKWFLGTLYYRGAGVSQSYEKAFKYHLEGAERGNVMAIEAVAALYKNGIGCKRDIDKALEWYKKGTDKAENAVWVNEMGEMYEWKNDIENAAKAYKRASDKLARASFNLARLYHRGLLGAEDYMLHAIKYYRLAAESGWTEANAELGKIYFLGATDGVERQSFEKAEIYLSKAANAGKADSQYILAHMHEYGLGVDKSSDLAIDYYRKAALQGHVLAQYALGQLLLNCELHSDTKNGDGEAFKWIEKAYEQGDWRAKKTVADMYKYGIGCMEDEITSKDIIKDIINNHPDEITSTIESIYKSI